MRFILETITGRKGIKNFSSLEEYVDFMTKNGDKIKNIVESDLPYDDKPVSVATPSQSNGWEQVNKATFGDVIKKAEKGDCVLPHKASSVFKDEAKFEPSKTSDKADTSSEPKVDSTHVKNNNEGEEKDLPKFEYKDEEKSSSGTSEKSEPKEEKKDSEEKDDKKKEIKESLEEDDDINPQVLQELYEIICDQMGDDYLSDYDEVDYMELLDCVKDFGNDIDGFNSELAREYADALQEKWKSEHSNNLNEGFKDKFKKAVATGAMAASLAAGNAHGMTQDPYYDGATRPYEDSYEQVSDYEKPQIKQIKPDGTIVDQYGNEYTKEQFEALLRGEDPFNDNDISPEMMNDIEEALRIAGVQLNEAEDDILELDEYDSDPMEDALDCIDSAMDDFGPKANDNYLRSVCEDCAKEYGVDVKKLYHAYTGHKWSALDDDEYYEDNMDEDVNNPEDGEVDEKSGKEKLFEEGDDEVTLEKAKENLAYWKNQLLIADNGDDFSYSNGKHDRIQKQVNFWKNKVKELSEGPKEDPFAALYKANAEFMKKNGNSFEHNVGEKLVNIDTDEVYKIKSVSKDTKTGETEYVLRNEDTYEDVTVYGDELKDEYKPL